MACSAALTFKSADYYFRVLCTGVKNDLATCLVFRDQLTSEKSFYQRQYAGNFLHHRIDLILLQYKRR